MRSETKESTRSSVKLARKFASALRDIELDNVFNPYRDVCDVHDNTKSPHVRFENLVSYLSNALELRPKTAWIGRDLGYRGGRRTGLPLTDEAHLPSFSSAFNDARAIKATCTSTVAERTAAEIWRVIEAIESPPFLWNAFPFHPHEASDPLNNRCHTRHEFEACESVFVALIEEFHFERIYALGNDAGRALERLGVSHVCIRHPSYGGQTEFRSKMAEAYNMSSTSKQECLLI